MVSNWGRAVNRLLGAAKREFGENVTYTPANRPGPSFVVDGIFNEMYQEVDQGGVVVTSQQPNLGIRLSDFPNPPFNEDKVAIRGFMYKVIDVQPDGEGGAKLLLHQVVR